MHKNKQNWTDLSNQIETAKNAFKNTERHFIDLLQMLTSLITIFKCYKNKPSGKTFTHGHLFFIFSSWLPCKIEYRFIHIDRVPYFFHMVNP